MNKSDPRTARLENALRQARRAASEDAAGAGDVDDILLRVGRLPRHGRLATFASAGRPSRDGDRRLFGQLAAGAGLVAACAAAFALYLGIGPEYELLRLYALDPGVLAAALIFGA